MKGAIGAEMSTEWVGMECNKDNIKQCLGNYLQSSVQSAAMDGFPIDKHVVFDYNMGLAEWLAKTIVHILQDVLANFSGIAYEVTNGATLRVIEIGLDQTTVRWKPRPYCTMSKSLDGGSRGRELSGQEKFAV
jgi:hypothetical protein